MGRDASETAALSSDNHSLDAEATCAQGPGLSAASMDRPAPHLRTGRSNKIGSVHSALCPPQAAQGKIECVPLFALLSSTGSSPVPQGSWLPGLRPPKCLGRQLLIHTSFFFFFSLWSGTCVRANSLLIGVCQGEICTISTKRWHESHVGKVKPHPPTPTRAGVWGV